MTVEQELERFYGDLRPDPEAERRVIAAVTRSAPTPRRWRPLLAVALSAAAVAVAAMLVAVLRPDGRSHSQQHAVHEGPVVVPPARANAVVGAVTDNGRPVSGAHVYVEIWPSQQVEDRLKDGEAAPLLNAGRVTTGPDGGFDVAIPAEAFTSKWLTGGRNGFFNVDFDVVLPGERDASTSSPIDLQGGRTRPMTLIFDVGRMTVNVNGEKSALRWIGGASPAIPAKTR